jgi:transposase-like protein
MTVRRHRRYSTDFKIQLVNAYLDGVGSIRAIANQHGIPHSLLPIWIRKFEAGELAEEVHLQEQVSEYQAKVAGLERKIGQLTMELDALKKRVQIRPLPTNGIPSIISGPEASPSDGGASS